MAAVANAAIVPTVNILCVLVFARYGSAGRMPMRKVFRQLALNPLVLACFAGILVQALGTGLPPGIEPVLKALGQASLPLGLLCVGAALDLRSVRQWLRPVGYSSAVKFLVMPMDCLPDITCSDCTARRDNRSDAIALTWRLQVLRGSGKSEPLFAVHFLIHQNHVGMKF